MSTRKECPLFLFMIFILSRLKRDLRDRGLERDQEDGVIHGGLNHSLFSLVLSVGFTEQVSHSSEKKLFF